MNIPHDVWTTGAVALTNTLLGALVWMLRHIITIVRNFIDTHEQTIETLGRTTKVVDMHTDVLATAGWTRGLDIPHLNRRKTDPGNQFPV